jgi:two-component system, chemotaxis family, sensor kinase Cph1
MATEFESPENHQTQQPALAQLTRDLKQALDLLWEANSELKQFAHFTSHDLKTPLGTVANMCEEALDEFGGEMPAECRKLIEAARRTVFRMSSTIDELLSASVVAHETHPEERVAGEAIVNEALERAQPLIKKRQIEVVRDSTFPTVLGNKAQLREVFFNLFTNAAKYIEGNSGRIEICARQETNQCVFTVADNGPGIPRDELERIFSPFRRLAAHRGIPGTGLGLYFTRNLVERQGGRIWAESEPGQGSRFFVLLRCADGETQR